MSTPTPTTRHRSTPHKKGQYQTDKDKQKNQGTSQCLRHLSTPSITLGREGYPKNGLLLRKEVIQPHLPVRLPCYDFVPIASPTFDHSLPKRG